MKQTNAVRTNNNLFLKFKCLCIVETMAASVKIEK